MNTDNKQQTQPVDKIHLWDGIDNSFEVFTTKEEIKQWIRKNYMDTGDIHPDIESLKIYRPAGCIWVEEKEDRTILHIEVEPDTVESLRAQLDLKDQYMSEQSKQISLLSAEIDRLQSLEEREGNNG